MKNNQLFNGALLFFLFITGALIFSGITHKTKGYKTANSDILDEMVLNDYSMSYLNFENLYRDSSATFTIVDVRKAEKYAQNNLKNAINIPFNTIIEKENLNKMAEDKNLKLVIADDQGEAVLAYLMWRASGIDNIKIIPGTFDLLYQHIIIENNPAYYYYNDDKARWDYKRQMGGESSSKNSIAPQIP